MRSHTLTRKLPDILVPTAADLVYRGNWGVDLQAGSQYGYKLLFVVLLSGIFAVFLQVCSSSSYENISL